MVQVKEFLNYGDSYSNHNILVNEWLREKGDSIEVIDIKYSVAVIQGDSPQEVCGILAVYKER